MKLSIHKEGDPNLGYTCDVNTTPNNDIQFCVCYWGQIFTDTYGDSDLEYFITIKNEDLPSLCCYLIADQFKDEKAFVQWLRSKSIPHDVVVY
jgi:hypothetical protein